MGWPLWCLKELTGESFFQVHMLSLKALNFKTGCNVWRGSSQQDVDAPNWEMETIWRCPSLPGSAWQLLHLPSRCDSFPLRLLVSSSQGLKPPVSAPLYFSDLVFPVPTHLEILDTCWMQFTLEKETRRGCLLGPHITSVVSKRDLLLTSGDVFRGWVCRERISATMEADGLPEAAATLSLWAVWPWTAYLPCLSHDTATCRCSVKWNEIMYDRPTASGASCNVF